MTLARVGLPALAGVIKEELIMDQLYENERTGALAGADNRKCKRTKHHRIRLGVLLILIGLLWLSTLAGWIAGNLFCPLTMILIGLWICIPSVWPRIRRAV